MIIWVLSKTHIESSTKAAANSFKDLNLNSLGVCVSGRARAKQVRKTMVMNHKHKHVMVKSVILILLMGLAFSLFLSNSMEYSPEIETPFPEKNLDSEQPISVPDDEDQDEIPLPKKAVASEPSISAEEDQDQNKPPNKGNYLASLCWVLVVPSVSF